MFNPSKPSALSASKDTISGQKFFFTNNNPLFSSIPSAKSTTIMPGTSIVTRLSNSSPSQAPHPFQMSLPGPTSSISAPTMPTRFNLFSSQSNNLHITRNVLPPSTKVLNEVQKEEAKATRRIIGKKVSDVVNIMQRKVQEAKAAGVPFKRYVNPNFRPKRNRKVHASRYDPAPVVFYFKQMVEKGMYPNVLKAVLIRAADWLILGKNGCAHFMYVWLMTNCQEVLSAVAMLVAPDVLDENEILASVSQQLSNARPVPLGILAVLPTITTATVPKVQIQRPPIQKAKTRIANFKNASVPKV